MGVTMPPFEPRNPLYEQRVRDSFALQGVMHHMGAQLGLIAPGAVDIELAWAKELTQQHGFLHAGVVSAASFFAACSPATAPVVAPPSVQPASI